MGKQAIEWQTTIWTIGHCSRSMDTFSELLRANGIQVPVDVRSFPTSKTEHFKKEQMEPWVPERGIQYVWLCREFRG